AQRISSRDGGQLRALLRLCLRVFRLCCFCLYLRRFSLSRCLFRLCLGFCGRLLRCFRFRLRFFFLSAYGFLLYLCLGGTGGVFGRGLFIRLGGTRRQQQHEQQHEQQVSPHDFSFRLVRLRRSAIHLTTSASSGTSRLYAS